MFIAPPTSPVETPALVEQRQRELLARAERHRLIATARRLPHRHTPPTAAGARARRRRLRMTLPGYLRRHRHTQRR